MNVGAVDIGTNSVRVLAAAGDGDGDGDGGGSLRELERVMRITRLGQDVNRTGRLAPEAIERTVACLRDYRAVLERNGVERVRVAATSAARDAANREEFFDLVEEALGTRPELLSGDEEGRLSFAGATVGVDPQLAPFLVVDIGGGSTELIVGRDDVEGVCSLDIGCVRITEAELHHDPPAPEELSNALAMIEFHLEDALRLLPDITSARTFIGLAGTITTVAAVELGLPEHDRSRTHHFRLTHAAAEDVFRTLATEARADRIHNPGLEEARADVIVGGCCVLVSLFRKFGFDECLVSESDILDGLALSLLG